jgi:hypothetical protein
MTPMRTNGSRRSVVATLAVLLVVPSALSVLLGTHGQAGAVSAFTPGDIVVYRVGGGATLSGASAQVSLNEYTPTGTLVQSLSMPTSTSGSNRALTASGTATSEGLLTLSADGRYLMATGYDTGVGTANINSSGAATIPRTVARVDGSDTIDTSTALTDFADGNNPRSATSSDGSNIWVGGAAGGVRFTTLGSTTSTSLNAGDKNVRQVSIAQGQLYTSADPTKQSVTIATVGSGLPTSAGQTISNLAFQTASAPSEPYAYTLMTLGAGPGPDTMYVADNTNNVVERFNLVSGVWTPAGTAAVSGVIGVTGLVSSGNVTLYATSTNASGNSGTLSTLVDSSGPGGTLTATASTIATASSGFAFRGVAFAPGTVLGTGGGGGPTPTITPDEGALPAALGDPTNATLHFVVSDPSFTADQLTVTATSSDQSVAPNSGITVSGSSTDRVLTVTPAAVGDATISITAVAPDHSQSTTTISYGVSAAAPDPTTARYYSGAGNASTAIDVGGGYMLVGDDESDVLRLYQEGTSGPPVKTFDFTSLLPFGTTEVDIEASARAGDRIYWEGSMSNGASGDHEPARSTLFATDITGSGLSTNLTYVGSYTGLAQDLISWDENNGSGLGANYFGLAASASVGVPPHEPDAMTAEGLEFAPGSTTTAYLGFRAPLEPTSNRNLALVIPITNIDALVDNGNPGTTHASFGPPLQWNLGALGVREIRKNADNQYLIIAGASDETPGQFLYKWDGVPADPPRLSQTTLPLGADRGNWESIVSVPDPLVSGASFQALQDNGDTAWYGDTLTSKNGLNPDLEKDLGDTFSYVPPAPLPTATSLVSSKNPSQAADPVTYTATVTLTSPPPGAGTPTGTVEFTDAGTDIAGCAMVAVNGAGQAACPTVYPVKGSHDIVATYSGGITGNDVDAGSNSPDLSQLVGLAPSTTNLSSTTDPVGVRQSVTFEAVVTGAGAPTGTVEFTDGGADITGCAAVPLDGSGDARCTTTYTKASSNRTPPHQIAAAYGGDNANGPSGDSLTQAVTKSVVRYTTTTGLSASDSTIVAGQPLTLTATVSTVSGAVTGKVRFFDGTKVIKGCASITPNGAGVAQCHSTIKTSGMANVTAEFLGDKFDSHSTSTVLPIDVTTASTDTAVTSSANPTTVGSTVTFTATVTSPSGATPKGSVAFSIGGTAIASCTAKPLSGAGIATCKTVVSVSGDQTVEADYGGNPGFAASSGMLDESAS